MVNSVINYSKEKLKLQKILSEKKLKKLLFLEKEKRGVQQDKLVFIGMADLAEYYWCSAKSLFKNKEMELWYFASYLEDRITYSLLLGIINKIPDSDEKILDVGDEISFDNIEDLLKKRRKVVINAKPYIITKDKDNNVVLLISQDLSHAEKEDAKKRAEIVAKGKKVIIKSIEDYPKMRGSLLHLIHAEKYPSIRWNFSWKDYVIVGIPDGITDDFVYEFKTTRSWFLYNYVKPVAFMQGDLYGYFFRRPKKRVQIYITQARKKKTFFNEVRKDVVLLLLNRFRILDNGLDVPVPPKAWKCRVCEYREICKYSQFKNGKSTK